jgi:polyhydroxyalkanoate synthesis regulator phasin
MTFQVRMDAKHEILLEQILEELRAQTKALQELRSRVDGLERALSHDREAEKAISEADRRS